MTEHKPIAAFTFGPEKDTETDHPQIHVTFQGKTAIIDEGMLEDIMSLWFFGYDTIFSCQGDEDHSRYVIILGKPDENEIRKILPWATGFFQWPDGQGILATGPCPQCGVTMGFDKVHFHRR